MNLENYGLLVSSGDWMQQRGPIRALIRLPNAQRVGIQGTRAAGYLDGNGRVASVGFMV